MHVVRGFGFGTLLLPVNFPKPYLSVSLTVETSAQATLAGQLLLRIALPAGAQMGTAVTAAQGWTCSSPGIGQTGTVSCTSHVPFAAGTSATFSFKTGAVCGYCQFDASLSADMPDAPVMASTTAVPVDGKPMLHRIDPTSGNVAGGYFATITGDSLGTAATVTIGTTPVKDIAADGARLTFLMPPGIPGSVDVRVVTAGGLTLTLPAGFTYVGGAGDLDNDGLDDTWERLFGLRSDSGDGDEGGAGDPDGDGFANLAEQAAGTHPRGFFTRYLAEGATSAFFDTQIAVLNPGQVGAKAALRFLRSGQAPITHSMAVPIHRRVTVHPKGIAGLAAAEFSTVVESDQPLVVDRTMSWDATGYGAHSETAVAAPAPRWYLAEGATIAGFQLFYLLQNPSTHDVQARVRYLRTTGPPLEKTYTLPAQSRQNIWANGEQFDGLGPALANAEFSAVVETLDGTPIIVERAMYLSGQGRTFNAGHESAGVTTPATRWFLAEGATGNYFDLFVLIANPTDADAQVKLTYLLGSGETFTRTMTAAANARSGVWVDREQFDGTDGFPLADVAVSTTIESLNEVPLVVERAMWWPGDGSTWHEAHNSAGTTIAGTTWAVAEGEVGGTRHVETYLLVANTSAFAGSARVTLYFEDGTSAEKTYTLIPSSRTNVNVAADFGASVVGKRFGAVVQSLGATPAQVVVERAMYWDAGGVTWAAGTNAVATRLDPAMVTEVSVANGSEVSIDVLSQVQSTIGAAARLVRVEGVPSGAEVMIDGGRVHYRVPSTLVVDHELTAIVEDAQGNETRVPLRIRVKPLAVCSAVDPPDVIAGDVTLQGAAAPGCAWSRNTTQLTVALSGGDNAVRSRVMREAARWEEFSGIRFNFVDGVDGDIRVTFDLNGRSWSMLGTCRNPGPTMNLGWFTASTSDEEIRRTTLHQFGHALGLHHEHLTPTASINWNRPVVYKYYAALGWDTAMVDHKVFNKANSTNYAVYDPTSIMQYPIPPEHTTDGYSVGSNTALSVTDKLFIATLYRGAPAPEIAHGSGGRPEARTAVLRTADAWRKYWNDSLGQIGAEPSVDFARSMVLVIELGQRPTPGYRVVLQAGYQIADTLRFSYTESGPTGPVIQVLSNEFAAFAIPQFIGPVSAGLVQ